MFEPRKDENSIDALKKRLYTRGDMGRRPLRKGRLEEFRGKVDDNWGNESPLADKDAIEPVKPKSSMFNKFFIGSLLFFILAFAYAAYQFFAGSNLVSAKNIDITVLGPAFASGGDELSLQVSVINRNAVPLEFSELFVEYPKGAANANASSTPEMVRDEIKLKQIPAGGTASEIVKATLYGQEGAEQTIKFMLEYRIQGSNAIFRKESTYPVKISSAPVNISLEAPKETNSGQDLTFKINISSNTAKDVPNVLLQVVYPPGFTFKKGNPEPAYGDNVWRLGDFHTGSSREVTITGSLVGQNGDERTFRILSGSPSQDDEKTVGVIYNSLFQTVAINRPFLDAQVSLNGDSGDSIAIAGGRLVRGEIIWKNNLPTRIADAEIVLAFSGSALNRQSVSSDHGFYNSSADSIVWDKNSVPDFRTIEPGATGRLTFSFSPQPLYSAGSGILNKPEVDMSLTVKGNVNSSDGGGGAVSVTTGKSAKVSSDLQLLSRAVYFTGPMNNTGPMPPQAEKETTYTVLWSVTNSANEVGSALVTTTLPPYVDWTGEISPANENISYDAGSRAVSWNLGTVEPGTGYQNQAREVAFQIKLKPSLSHVGSSVGITGGVSFSGKDGFSGAVLGGSKDALSTYLTGDPNFRSGYEIVKP